MQYNQGSLSCTQVQLKCRRRAALIGGSWLVLKKEKKGKKKKDKNPNKKTAQMHAQNLKKNKNKKKNLQQPSKVWFPCKTVQLNHIVKPPFMDKSHFIDYLTELKRKTHKQKIYTAQTLQMKPLSLDGFGSITEVFV